MIEAILFIIILLLSIIIHEVAHGWMAYKLGDNTALVMGRLSLNPLVHLDPVGSIIVPLLMYFSTGFVFGWAKPVPFNPLALADQKYGVAKVALAGPLANLLLVVFFSLFFRLMPLSAFGTIILINLILALFNLVPIPPLDGSKILLAFSPKRWQGALIFFEQYGFIFLLIFIWFFWGLVSPLISALYSFLLGA